MITHQEVAEFVKQLQLTVTAWEQSTSPNVQWRGNMVRAITVDVETAANELFESCDTAEVDPGTREIVLAVDRFQEAMEDWKKRLQLQESSAGPQGSAKFWAAYSEMLTKLSPRTKKLPEPIGQLIKQEVSYPQIAKIYGWYDDAGVPDIRRLQEEIDKPGTHYNPATWVSANDRAFELELATAWSSREARRQAARVVAMPARTDPRETLDQLIDERVSVRQIAKMLKIDEETVRRRAAEIGIGLDSQTIHYANANERGRQAEINSQQQINEGMAIAKLNSHPELPTLEERVLACAVYGHSHSRIAQMLERDYVGINYQKVGRILKQAEQ